MPSAAGSSAAWGRAREEGRLLKGLLP